MHIIVDGYIYQRKLSRGIARVFSEILPRVCELDPSLRVKIFTSGTCHQEIPSHPNISHQALFPIDDFLRPSKLWSPIQQPLRSAIRQMSMDSDRGAVWHSTYYTRPKSWKGPKVVTVYDMIHERFPNLYNTASDKRLRREKRKWILDADRVLCISNTTLVDVRNYYDIDYEKLVVIPIAFSNIFRKQTQDGCRDVNKKPFILYVGRRGHYKNFRTLLVSYCEWHQRHNVDLVVVGPDWSAEERQWLSKYGCEKQVRLLRDIDDQKLACLYSYAQAFVHSSLFEGFGIPILESMACGCPVVASRIPSTLEIAGDHPFYFEPTNVSSLLSALDAALSEGRQPGRIETGINRAEQYSWKKTAGKTLQVYCSLIN